MIHVTACTQHRKTMKIFFLSDYLRNLEMQIVNVTFCSQREEVKIKNMYMQLTRYNMLVPVITLRSFQCKLLPVSV